MPNWCFTRINIINHNDDDRIENLYNLIKEWSSNNYVENDFGPQWLGNIVGNSGIGTIDEGKETDLRCRGRLNYIELVEKNQLLIDTETAWSPMLKMWVKILDKYLPNAELIYEAEECGNELYSTNNESLKDKYIIDCWGISEIESNWEASKEDVINILQKLLNTTEKNTSILINLLEDSEYNEMMSVHRWNFDDISEWD